MTRIAICGETYSPNLGEELYAAEPGACITPTMGWLNEAFVGAVSGEKRRLDAFFIYGYSQSVKTVDGKLI